MADVLCSLDPDEANSIRMAQRVLDDAELRANLTFIKAHFSILPQTITLLEESGTLLTTQLERLQSLEAHLGRVPGIQGRQIHTRLIQLNNKNTGLDTMEKIGQILSGEVPTMATATLPQNLSPAQIADFKYAPVTTCDTERSFSRYKQILTNTRMSFNFENLKMHFVIQCYQKT